VDDAVEAIAGIVLAGLGIAAAWGLLRNSSNTGRNTARPDATTKYVTF
jgi:hypothetical protein